MAGRAGTVSPRLAAIAIDRSPIHGPSSLPMQLAARRRVGCGGGSVLVAACELRLRMQAGEVNAGNLVLPPPAGSALSSGPAAVNACRRRRTDGHADPTSARAVLFTQLQPDRCRPDRVRQSVRWPKDNLR
jgi:hypothetical protein